MKYRVFTIGYKYWSSTCLKSIMNRYKVSPNAISMMMINKQNNKKQGTKNIFFYDEEREERERERGKERTRGQICN